MAYTIDQIEKHTIVTRLAVSIYKMKEPELYSVIEALDEDDGFGGDQNGQPLADLSSEKNDEVRRQMMIARLFVLIKQLDRNALLERLKFLKGAGLKWVREYPRLDCFLIVDFAAQGKAYRSCIRDISANGVFIETSDKFEPNQEVALCFTLGEASDVMPFKIGGRVTRIYPDGIGVQYENVTHYQREILDTLINRNF